MSVENTRTNADDPALLAELLAIAEQQDTDISLSDPDAPETRDWSNAVVGRFYKIANPPEGLRLDPDILDYFKASGPGYEARINHALRAVMLNEQKR